MWADTENAGFVKEKDSENCMIKNAFGVSFIDL